MTTSYHLELEELHRLKAEALRRKYNLPTKAALFRFFLYREELEVEVNDTPEREDWPSSDRTPTEAPTAPELPGLATYDNGPAADDPPGETPTDPPPDTTQLSGSEAFVQTFLKAPKPQREPGVGFWGKIVEAVQALLSVAEEGDVALFLANDVAPAAQFEDDLELVAELLCDEVLEPLHIPRRE